MRAVLSLLVFALLASCAFAAWTNCGTANDDIVLSPGGLSYTPDPPVKGQSFSVSLNGQAQRQINGGTVELSVSYLHIPLYSHTFNLCQQFGQFINCPVPSGPFNRNITTTFPSGIPSGEYTGKIVAKDDASTEILCITFDIKPAGAAAEIVAPELSESDLVLDDERIAKHNAAGHSWVAAHNEKFKGWTVGQVKQLLGSHKTPLALETAIPLTLHTAQGAPASFDWRQEKPACVHAIRDQGQCGSCWAFGATEALSDRFCIQKGVNVILSPQDLVSCDKGNYGCDGGYLNVAWDYMQKTGVLTDECDPYKSGGGSAPACKKPESSCKRYHSTAASHATDVNTIYTMIEKGGPVEAAFSVYSDFMQYKSGVYKKTSNQLLGGHAIKIVGWGNDAQGGPYWIVANSWGTSWGIDGFFWIARGVNECGIEGQVYAGDAGEITDA